MAGLALGPRSLLAALRVSVFTLCLSDVGGELVLGGGARGRWPRRRRSGGGGGGGATALLDGGPAGWYIVALMSVSLGGAAWHAPILSDEEGSPAAAADAAAALPTVIDTGSSFAYLPAPAVAVLRAGLAAHCAADSRGTSRACGWTDVVASALPPGQSACFNVSGGAAALDDARLPPLTLTFAGGATLIVEPRHYIVAMDWLAPLRCLGVYDDAHAGGRAVIGANLLLDTAVTIDAGAQRAEFRPANCPAGPDGGGDGSSHKHTDEGAATGR